ncbi:MAG: methyltransferase domain-containing protein [Ardenticatenaceae bacterium]|nr:methyltransferase domain-containing protein [Anaerolineales bacterium]MCB8940718.1 methyltransferase domain-containing protein [Ardenticatenaceae bacterium]MCB8972057.1 methyltransferase domain-containing protein [Ardenticatenaceae bacterium]
MSEADGRKWWQQQMSPIKKEYVQQFAQGQTALDIGTGAGFYGRLLQQQGFAVVGADLEPQAAYPYPVVQARLAQLPFVRPFDTVLAFDILEHEPLEAEALGELRRLTGKRLLLSVPNADDSLLTPYNLTFKHHIDKTHQREYGLEELKGKLTQAGFEVTQIARRGPVSPAVLAEFVRPFFLQKLARFLIKALFKLKILHNARLMADLYVVAEPV